MAKEKTKHTPGPWRVGFEDGSHGDDIVIIAPDMPLHSCVVVQVGGIEENDANANLIAAAPAMLEALQAVKVCPYCTFSNWSSGVRQHMKDCTLAAAIKAATGQ